MTTPNKHHENAPSSAGAIMMCNNFESGGSDDSPFSDSNTGTKMHTLIEAIINGRDKVDTIKDHSLSDEHAEAVELSASDLNDFITAEFSDLKPGMTHTETPVEIKDNSGNVISAGTVDLSVGDGHKFLGCDHKASFGFNLKNAYHEPQMAHYALGLMQKHNIDEILWLENHMLPRRIISYTLTREQCEAIVGAVYMRRYHTPKRFTCNYFCRYCRKITWCPAVIKHIDALGCHVKKETLDLFKNCINIVDGKEMSDLLISTVDQVEQYGKKIGSVVKRVKAAAKALSDSGVPIPHFERSPKTTKNVTSITKAFGLVPEVSVDEFEKCVKMSIPNLSKKYKSSVSGNITHKQAADIVFTKLLPVIEMSTTYSLKRKLEK